MKAWNCLDYADFPEETDFCTRECPMADACLRAQSRKLPLTVGKVIACYEKRERYQNKLAGWVNTEIKRRTRP